MSVHFALLSIGALFLVGLIADMLGRWTHVPRVTLLILAGLLIGPTGLTVISDIDDTIKVTQVTNRKTMLRRTFLERFEPELLTQVARAAGADVDRPCRSGR